MGLWEGGALVSEPLVRSKGASVLANSSLVCSSKPRQYTVTIAALHLIVSHSMSYSSKDTQWACGVVTHMATNLSHHTISGKGSGKRQYKVHVIAAGFRRFCQWSWLLCHLLSSAKSVCRWYLAPPVSGSGSTGVQLWSS